MLLGVIGDDFTGSSDIGNMLARSGMNTIQYVGVPDDPAQDSVEAGIVSLKTRSVPVEDAIRQSLDALGWLRAQGCRQFVFKYCSTFDSTPEGNIGPVAEALAEMLDTSGVIACPAFPATGRSVYQGHLFVNGTLLNESGLESHPLTPMSDPDIRRWLAKQSRNPVGHIPIDTIEAGVDAIRQHIADKTEEGCCLLIADAIRNQDLITLGRACADAKLLTGGSGITLGLAQNFRSMGLLGDTGSTWEAQTEGKAAILSGSCSRTTLRQVELYARTAPARAINPEEIMTGGVSAQKLIDWALASDGVPLIYSSSSPQAVTKIQEKFGRDEIADRIEGLFAEVARGLVKGGVTRLITAGGETSGAVVEGLEISELAIGPEIDPGVPALRARPDLALALKSGNFGAEDFFAKAETILMSQA